MIEFLTFIIQIAITGCSCSFSDKTNLELKDSSGGQYMYKKACLVFPHYLTTSQIKPIHLLQCLLAIGSILVSINRVNLCHPSMIKTTYWIKA